MLRDVYSVFLLALNFLKKNIAVLIPFYIYYLFVQYSDWGEYEIGISFVMLLLLYAFIAVVIREKEIEVIVNIYKWQIMMKALWNTIIIFLFNFVVLIVGGILLGAISLFSPLLIINILQFVLVMNTVVSFLFGIFAMSFLKNITPVEAIGFGLRSFYSNFLFYVFVILTGMLILMISLMLENLINIKFLGLLVNPILTALQAIFLVFAFWQKTNDKNNISIA